MMYVPIPLKSLLAGCARGAAIVCLLWGQSLVAQARFASLPELMAYADAHSTVAQASALKVQAATEDEAVQRSGILPRLAVYGTSEYSPVIGSLVIPAAVFGGPEGSFRAVQMGMPWVSAAGVEGSVPVLNLEKWEQQKRARMQIGQASLSRETQLENLHLQLAQVYYTALAARQQIRVADENVATVAEMVREITARQQEGIASPSELYNAQGLHIDATNVATEYRRMYNQAMIGLRQLLQVPPRDSMSLATDLSALAFPTPGALAPGADNARPALREAEGQSAIAQQSLLETLRAPLPRVSLYGRYAQNWQVSNVQTVHYDASTFGVRIDAPIFQGGFYKHQQARSTVMLQSAQVQQQETASALARQQAEWQNNYAAATAKNAQLALKLKVFAENLRVARLNMQEGVTGFEEFNTAFQSYARAQTESCQNIADGLLYHTLIMLTK